MKRKVYRVDRSPMNPGVWCIELECGHEIWKPARARPKAQEVECPECPSDRETRDGGGE